MLLGTDLIDLPALAQRYERFGLRFLARCLSSAEQDACLSLPHQHQQVARLGGYLAAKEATAKALGVGLNGLGYGLGIAWHDVSIGYSPTGKPELTLTGRAKAIASQLGIEHWQLSISHSRMVATATVIGQTL